MAEQLTNDHDVILLSFLQSAAKNWIISATFVNKLYTDMQATLINRIYLKYKVKMRYYCTLKSRDTCMDVYTKHF